VENRCGLLDESPNIAGQEPSPAFPLELLTFRCQCGFDIAPVAEESPFPRFQGFDLILGQHAFELANRVLRALLGDGLLHVLLDRNTLEEPAYHVEDLVAAELLADALQLLEQGLHDTPFTRFAGNQIEDNDGVVLLLVAVDSSHPLFQPGGVPGYVPVQEPPGELKVDTLARGVGADHVKSTTLSRFLAEELDLILSLAELHPTVDLGNLTREPESLQSTNEILKGITMLGEDDELFVAVLGILQHFAKFLKLGLVPVGIDTLRQFQKLFDPIPFRDQFGERDGDDTAHDLLLGDLVLLYPCLGRFLVARLLVQNILRVVEFTLHLGELIDGDLPGLNRFDQTFELSQSTLE